MTWVMFDEGERDAAWTGEIQPWTGVMAKRVASHHPAASDRRRPNSITLRWELEGIAYIELEHHVAPGRMNIAAVWVDPEYQNLGIGTALMRLVLHEADEAGMEMWLVPQAFPGKKTALLRFYRRFGFKLLGKSGYMIRKAQPRIEE